MNRKHLNPHRYARRVVALYRKNTTKSAFVVAGLGRCGTRLIKSSLIHSGMESAPIFLSRLDDEKEYRPGYVYKTHDYPPAHLPPRVKLIYLFGNPMNIAISAHGKINAWGRQHHEHLRSDLFTPNDLILHQDTLLLHQHFDAWYQRHGFDFISLRYETLYEASTHEVLNAFLGFKLALRPFRERKSDYRVHPHKEVLLKTYARLNERIQAAENVKIWNRL